IRAIRGYGKRKNSCPDRPFLRSGIEESLEIICILSRPRVEKSLKKVQRPEASYASGSVYCEKVNFDCDHANYSSSYRRQNIGRADELWLQHSEIRSSW